MACTIFQLPSGTTAIVCGAAQTRKRCKFCGRPAYLLCDWKTPAKSSGTCDLPICDRCTTKPAPDKDLCPTHATEWKKSIAAKAKMKGTKS